MRDVVASIQAAATLEAGDSGLPGAREGPADALRHIIGAAELRRVGLAAAFVALEGNQIIGAFREYSEASTRMDRTNNPIGLAIGGDAKTFEEVVARARAAVQAGLEAEGTGAGGTPMWQPRHAWSGPRSPPPVPDDAQVTLADRAAGANPYRFGGIQHGFLRGLTAREAESGRLADLAQVPPEAWPDADVRAVIRSRPCSDGRDPSRAGWHQRVRAFFEGRRRAGPRARCGASRQPKRSAAGSPASAPTPEPARTAPCTSARTSGAFPAADRASQGAAPPPALTGRAGVARDVPFRRGL